MMTKKIGVLLCLLSWALMGSAFIPPIYHSVDTAMLRPTEQQIALLKKVAELALNYNFKKVPLNDSLSKEIFQRYLKTLDENKSCFIASDIDEFETYQTQLDDDIRSGNLNHVFEMYNVFKIRYREHLEKALEFVDEPYPFNTGEIYTFDRRELPWMINKTEMDHFWKLRITYDLLSLKLEGNTLDNSKKILKERYHRLKEQIEKLTNQDVFQYFMDAFTEAIDPHTNYFNPTNAAEFNIQMSRQLEGIGVTLVLENEYVTIKGIVPGGPADKSKQMGLEDRIVAVAQGEDGKFQHVVGWRLDDVVALTRGKQGSTVRLEVLPADQPLTAKPKEVIIVREKIVLQDQSAKSEVKVYQDHGKQRRIGIISIPAFYVDFKDYQAGNPNYKSTTRDVKLLLDSLQRQGVDGVLIDLRKNGGGALWEAISLTGLFIKSGPVVQVKTLQQGVMVESDQDSSITYAGPLGVLVDRYSASASEIFSGAIQDYGRGIIIGSRTYGKGTVQNQVDLSQFFAQKEGEHHAEETSDVKDTNLGETANSYGQMNLTIGKFYRVNGNATQHRGVLPDIEFPSSVPLDRYGEDTESSALPYDTITPTNYMKLTGVSRFIPDLQQRHHNRMSKSISFRYLQLDINRLNKRLAETSVELNEDKLTKQRQMEEKESLEKNNKRRIAFGLKPLEKGERNSPKEKMDLVEWEGGQVLCDLIALQEKM